MSLIKYLLFVCVFVQMWSLRVWDVALMSTWGGFFRPQGEENLMFGTCCYWVCCVNIKVLNNHDIFRGRSKNLMCSDRHATKCILLSICQTKYKCKELNNKIFQKINMIYSRPQKKCRAAGQIGCQATGNSPGSPDGQSAPGYMGF